MKPILSPTDIHQVYQAIGRENLHPENAVQQLVAKGYEEDMARSLVHKLIKEHNTALFRQNLRRRKLEERKKASYLIILLIAVAGPLFGIASGLWYIVASVAAGLAGHFGKPDTPVAGIVGGILPVLLFPWTWSLYMHGRQSYITIELLVPLLMAVVPAWLLSLLAGSLLDNAGKN
jgi:hypothetical protein